MMKRTWMIVVLFAFVMIFPVIVPLEAYGDINDDMREAVKYGSTETVRALLNAGANVNDQRSDSLVILPWCGRWSTLK